MYDLIVIGGGPAGTSAAISAARNGARVLLLERGRFPRHKVCGEFVSFESLDLLGKLLGRDSAGILNEAVRVPCARIFLDNRALHLPVEPAAASVARFDLDKALWDSAQRSGAEARQQVGVQKVFGTGPFLVITSTGGFEARAVVNASGRWSNLSAAAPNGHTRERWIGLKAHFAESSPPASVDLYFFDGGYCGVQPVTLRGDSGQPRVNACAMVRADLVRTLPDVFRLHPALRPRATHWQPLTDPVSVAPLLFGKPQPVREGIFMVGDSAGFVDPFAGDGISLALRGGALAAECLAPFFRGLVPLEHAVHRYTEDYQQQFAPVFRSSKKIRRMLLLPRSVRAPIISFLARAPAVSSYLVRTTR